MSLFDLTSGVIFITSNDLLPDKILICTARSARLTKKVVHLKIIVFVFFVSNNDKLLFQITFKVVKQKFYMTH